VSICGYFIFLKFFLIFKKIKIKMPRVKSLQHSIFIFKNLLMLHEDKKREGFLVYKILTNSLRIK